MSWTPPRDHESKGGRWAGSPSRPRPLAGQTAPADRPCDRDDQAHRLRELARRHQPRGRMVAITSGKGGVGKSNIAVNLSVYCSARGLRTVLADVDLGLANADLLLDVQPRYTLSHVLGGVRTVGQIFMPGPAGLKFVPGVSGAEAAANLTDLERRALISQLGRLTDNTDIVVLDCGAGISHNVLGFALAADTVVVVTTPQPPALADAYATVKALMHERYRGEVYLVVNMARSRAQAGAVYHRLARVAHRFLNYSVANGGYMLHDTAVELAVERRCPFVVRDPECGASACIAAMAGDILRALAPSAASSGLLKRVAGLFL